MMKLSEIKKHSLFPFKDFKTNGASFLMLELFWTAVAYEALGEEISQTCKPIMDADKDGNPILFFWLPEADRAVNVELFDVVGGADETIEGEEYLWSPLYMYLGTCMTSYTSPEGRKIDELSITFDMSYQKYLKHISNAIRAFLIGKLSYDEVEKEINKLMRDTGEASVDAMNEKYKKAV